MLLSRLKSRRRCCLFGEERPAEFKPKPDEKLDERMYVFKRGTP
jgi:hypothetical protein